MILSDARTRTPKLVSKMPDARALRLSATEGFLLSCIDGVTSEHDLALVTGRGADEIRACLSRLESLGLISMAEAIVVPPRTSTFPRGTPSTAPGAYVGTSMGRERPFGAGAAILTPLPPRAFADDVAAMTEDIDLDAKLRTELLSLHGTLDRIDHYTLLGTPRGADKATIKRAYYELAAKFHPDKYFRKRLGTFKVRLEAVFSRLTLALETLSVPEKRAEYDAYLDEQARLRGIEKVLADAATEVERARESAERVARTEEPTPLAPLVAPRPPTNPPREPLLTPRPTVSSEADAAARREVLARRLLGGRSSSPSAHPSPRPSLPPMPTTAEAMESLRRRYEDRVAAAKTVEARKYAARGEEAARTNQVAKAASAFEVAYGLSPHDDELKRKAAAARAQADSVLGQTYRGQAEYEEKNGQWAEAARSWAGVCKARPDDASAHERAANAMVKVGGDPGEILRLAQRAVTLDPTSITGRTTLGNIHLTAGRGEAARRELESAASLAPDDSTIKQLLKRARKLD
jgi:tetratricopeptide (TPR) repeat protein